MFLALLLALGCGSEISIVVETAECTDYDFDAPETDALEVTEVDGDWHVSHKGVFMGCADIFDPDISGQGRKITVDEYWDVRTTDDCTICYAPTIVLEQPPAGNYEVSWYDGTSGAEVGVLEFEVD